MPNLILPVLRRNVNDAAQVATAVHRDQADKNGELITVRLARVAAVVRRFSEGCPFWSADHRDDAEQVAWLHEVIRTGRMSERDLRREGFSRIVIDAVTALRRQEIGSFQEWIEAICRDGDLTTVLVKMADLADILDAKQLAAVPSDSRASLKQQYYSAQSTVVEAACRKGWQGGDGFAAHLQ